MLRDGRRSNGDDGRIALEAGLQVAARTLRMVSPGAGGCLSPNGYVGMYVCVSLMNLLMHSVARPWLNDRRIPSPAEATMLKIESMASGGVIAEGRLWRWCGRKCGKHLSKLSCERRPKPFFRPC